MPAESIATGHPATAATPRSRFVAEALALLLRAAAPERRHVLLGIAWLALAAGLEALGPLAGKFLIDNYLLPRNAALHWPPALSPAGCVTGSWCGWRVSRCAPCSASAKTRTGTCCACPCRSSTMRSPGSW
jgi:ATP-binding cassette, subfamily B, multidrug efflux pump